MEFEEVVEQYQQLRQKYVRGEISEQRFEAAVNEMVVKDPMGRFWQLGVRSGKWYRYDDNTDEWVEDIPSQDAYNLEAIQPLSEIKQEDKEEGLPYPPGFDALSSPAESYQDQAEIVDIQDNDLGKEEEVLQQSAADEIDQVVDIVDLSTSSSRGEKIGAKITSTEVAREEALSENEVLDIKAGKDNKQGRRNSIRLYVMAGFVAVILVFLLIGYAVLSFFSVDVLGTFDGMISSMNTSGSDVLFQDDFSDQDTGWDIVSSDTGEVGYGNGFYYVIAKEDGIVVEANANRRFSDLVISVEAAQVLSSETNNNAYGVACKLQKNGDGYFFVISGNGYYTIYQKKAGNIESLVEWKQSEAINQGNTANLLQVACDDPNLMFLVNGQVLEVVQSSEQRSGDIGFVVTTSEGIPTRVEFDNILVTQP